MPEDRFLKIVLGAAFLLLALFFFSNFKSSFKTSLPGSPPSVGEYACPLEKSVCSRGTAFSEAEPEVANGVYWGNIDLGSPIFAIMDGKVDFGGGASQAGVSSTFVRLRDSDNRFVAAYSMPDRNYALWQVTGQSAEVKKGDVIAFINLSQEVADVPQEPSAQMLVVTVQDTKTKEYIKIDVEDFGR